MTMLEDELREMFQARVHTPPATMDPAGVAINRGEGRAARRRTVIGAVSVGLFFAILGGMASVKGPSGARTEAEYHGTFDTVWGPGGGEQPDRGPSESLPIVPMPVDVHVGTALWTTDGNKLTLPGVTDVIEVVRVPDGWLYSDDFRLHLLTVGGQSKQVGNDVSAWTVSNAGDKVATVTGGTDVTVKTPTGDQTASTSVPDGTRAVAFDGGRVVLSRSERAGSDSWDGHTTYRETWDDKLMVVYGGHGADAVGLYQQGPAVCLVDLQAASDGWQVGTILGCGDLLATAAKAGYGLSRGARSPDGRWLAVPSPTGVHMIDLTTVRAFAQANGPQGGLPAVAYTCASASDAPAVWANANTVLTVSVNNGVVACSTDGSRSAVQLPSGVSDGWALVRRFGVTG